MYDDARSQKAGQQDGYDRNARCICGQRKITKQFLPDVTLKLWNDSLKTDLFTIIMRQGGTNRARRGKI